MRVLVTGGAGFIGSHTLVELLAAGHEALVLDSFVNSTPVALERIGRIAGRAVPHVRADVRDRAAVEAALRAHRAEAVIHFAGLKAVGESTAKPLGYYSANVAGSVTLLQAMDATGCRRIVFSSSATVYGEPDYLPYDEVHPTRPESPYGRTKLMVEDILRDWAATADGASAVLLRYFNPVGAHPSGEIGEDPDGVPNNLMPFIARVAVGRLPELAVFGGDYPTRDGTGERDYIHVVDLARAHVAALGLEPAGAETINVGTGRGQTVLEMVKAFERACGRSIPHRMAPRRPGDIASFYADPARANARLGWHAEHDLDAMCRDVWTWTQRNPEGYPRE